MKDSAKYYFFVENLTFKDLVREKNKVIRKKVKCYY